MEVEEDEDTAWGSIARPKSKAKAKSAKGNATPAGVPPKGYKPPSTSCMPPPLKGSGGGGAGNKRKAALISGAHVKFQRYS